MRKILIIAHREYRAATRTKGFIIGLLVAPLLMSSGFLAMYLFGQQNDTADRTIGVVDRSGFIAPALVLAAERRNGELTDSATGKQIRAGYRIAVVSPGPDRAAQWLELSERIRREEIHGFLDVSPDEDPAGESGYRFRYFSDKPPMDGVKDWVEAVVNEELRRRRLIGLGLDPGLAGRLFATEQVEAVEPIDATGGAEARQMDPAKAVGIPMAMTFLIFMLTMIGATPLINSVMEEKTQGIAEVMLGSATPFQFMMGKVLGMLGVSLTASVVYIAGGIIGMMNAGMAGFIPFRVLPWFLAFLVPSILMLGSVMAGLGAACNDAKDAQNLALPGLLPVLLPLFLLMPVLQDPGGALATGLSLFPLFAPSVMILRMSTPTVVPAWQPWVGLVGVLLTTVLLVWVGGRIFRVGILLQGQPPRLGNLVRWIVRG